MDNNSKSLVWLKGEVKSPPFGKNARLKAGYLLRKLQSGNYIEFPDSRPMPMISKNCHELRIHDGSVFWRIIYHVSHDAIVILEVFKKKTQTTPNEVIDVCKKRLQSYLEITGD